jgi:hypothetical protein
MGAGADGLTLGTTDMSLTSCASPTAKKRNEDGLILFIGDNIVVANTTNGKVRGFVFGGINYLLSIPYGADTSAPQQMGKKYANNGVFSVCLHEILPKLFYHLIK